MEVGDVFICGKFDDMSIVDTGKKRWWCIFLGESNSLDSPSIFCYFHHTTTQLEHYRPSGDRHSHSVLWIKEGQWGFAENCLIDFESSPFSKPRSFFSKGQQIEVKGKVTEEGLRRIYDKIINSGSYPPKVKKDIFESFNRAGITGLRKPKKN